ncbi:tetratricopeptide repeat-containing protein [Algoriphagus machipongonensis]|uniref:DUF4071 domain-containing protein n=1 Tax=Algoriphagus machipongonensis TaxID=388413 RepID=A3I0I2_9BACT|nr:tetratricopeptide repeat-containing protein [Algoriphagus machipongonensis]EAZ79978.1 hypothetical protein ALPR1_15154 [Algoriphagus machipongonensis]
MDEGKKRCFVVMGFGTKTDYVNGRKLDLNKSYRLLIKPVVEQKGIECVRADEIPHSGSIDVQMYRELLKADLVIADLSTANPNALYELGIRHALRPYTTIVISEDKLVYPFDLNHILITKYQHLGDAIDYEEVGRFRQALGNLIDEVIDKNESDSPVYTYLNSLIPPKTQQEIKESIETSPESSQNEDTGKALSLIIQEAESAVEIKDFDSARDLFQSAVLLSKINQEQSDTYLIHRLAFCTYKAAKPDLISSLYKSLDLLISINLAHTNDPETVSTAGAVEKKLYECGEGDQHLENSILYYQRSFYLLNNRYNGINLAITFVYRSNSNIVSNEKERIADLVFAQRTWKRVIFLCERDWPMILIKEKTDASFDSTTEESQEMEEYYARQKFWITVNRAEAYFGLGNFELYGKYLEEAKKIPHPKWMWESFTDQIGRLEAELRKSGHLMDPIWTPPA